MACDGPTFKVPGSMYWPCERQTKWGVHCLVCGNRWHGERPSADRECLPKVGQSGLDGIGTEHQRLTWPLVRRQQRDRIGANCVIHRGQPQTVLERLGDQDAVEGVAMQRWQAGEVDEDGFLNR